MSKPTELTMSEQLMLLALRDDTGTLESRAGMHEFALGGAILAELTLAGRITLEDDKKKLVSVVERSPLGEPFLDEALESITSGEPVGRATKAAVNAVQAVIF